MNMKTGGWIGFIACVGMMATLSSIEISTLHTWGEATSPLFVAKELVHLGVVIGAFISGKVIPEDRDPRSMDRKGDTQ